MIAKQKLQTGEYERTRQIAAGDRFEYPLENMTNDLQAEFNRQGLDCFVEKVWKIRGPTQDSVVVETIAPSGSPIADIVVVAICAVILAIIGGIVIIYGLGFLERRRLADGRVIDIIHDIIDGFGHDSVDDMIQWKMANHPEEYAAHPHWCPWCGMEFSDEEKRNAHVEICPAAPPPVPPPPPLPERGPGYLLRYILTVIGWRLSIIRWPRR